MNISKIDKPLYIYVQRPDDGQWVVVGRHRLDQQVGMGWFRYADTYLGSAFPWAIDPINLPVIAGSVQEVAQVARYRGLHDVLRDACPDAWGQALIRREHGIPEDAAPRRFLALAGNGERWGALAVGTSPKPNVAFLARPKLTQLEVLARELTAMAENRPPVDAALRKRLFATPSLGGARPKATIADGDTAWLVKPGLRTDTVDLALLEHATQQWGRHAGMNFADTRHHALDGARSIVRILRFDRRGDRRVMAISAASLMQVEYPPAGGLPGSSPGYGLLAQQLRRIGAPSQDWAELFDRMVFNGIVGNDDDHARNHAAMFDLAEQRWRLAPAYDVVPNPNETPSRLVMQTSAGRWDISREAMLGDYVHFGFRSRALAGQRLDELARRIQGSFEAIARLLSDSLAALMRDRLERNLGLLAKTPLDES